MKITRKLKCNIFGHNWFTMTEYNSRKWCAYCARYTGEYPKMRERNPENKESLQTPDNSKTLNERRSGIEILNNRWDRKFREKIC
jgi:hypothetical protein